MQKDNDKKKGAVRTIAIPPETLAAIRIGGDMLKLADAIVKAVKLWGPVGTTDALDFTSCPHQHDSGIMEMVNLRGLFPPIFWRDNGNGAVQWHAICRCTHARILS